jgi:hypothetical protein
VLPVAHIHLGAPSRPPWLIGLAQQTSLLKASLAAQSELDTALTLAKSNLQVALLNNEMLEDALKQNGAGRDVGWRRLSAPQRYAGAEDATRASGDATPSASVSGTSTPSGASPVITSATPGTSPAPSVASASTSPTTAAEGSRFAGFKLPFSGPPSRSNSLTRSHLTSASLPSITPVPDGDYSEALKRAQEEKDASLKVARQEVEEVRGRLEKESEKLRRALGDKRALEEELESLSQALFEEVCPRRETASHL